MDNGWAAAARLAAADAGGERRAGPRRARRAPGGVAGDRADETGAAPLLTPVMPVPELRARLAALHPEPWPPDRAAAAAALAGWKAQGAPAATAPWSTSPTG